MARVVLPLRTWLVGSHLVVLSLPLLALVGTGALASDLRMQTKADLLNQGALIGLLVEAQLEHARAVDPTLDLAGLGPALAAPVLRAREATLAGVRVLDPSGVVVASSGDQLGEDLAHLPEVAEALSGGVGAAVRPRTPPTRQPLSSPSRRADVRVHLASPIVSGGELLGVVLLSRTPREELQALYQMAPRLSLGLGLALWVTVTLTLFSAYMTTRSLKRLSTAATHIAAGRREAARELADVQDSHVREVAELGVSVARMTDSLQDRLRYIGEFAGSVSHEFKTPLSTLKGTIELLREDEDMPASQKALFLDNAAQETERLERLVTGLLRLARAEEALPREPVELDPLLAAVVARTPGAALVGHAGGVQGSAAELELLFGNLVENARRHGGPQAHIQVQAQRVAGQVLIDVTDDGPGISPANLPRIFDRFFTTERTAGTGLGLALVRAVARAHGGEVGVQSQPGCTRFRVRLPA